MNLSTHHLKANYGNSNTTPGGNEFWRLIMCFVKKLFCVFSKCPSSQLHQMTSDIKAVRKVHKLLSVQFLCATHDLSQLNQFLITGVTLNLEGKKPTTLRFSELLLFFLRCCTKGNLFSHRFECSGIKVGQVALAAHTDAQNDMRACLWIQQIRPSS